MAKRADIQNDLLRPNHLPAVAVPDLQIRGWGRGGGGGGGHPDPEIRGAPVSKRFFRPFGPQFGLNIWGGGGASPGYPTVYWYIQSNFPRADALEKQMNCLQL